MKIAHVIIGLDVGGAELMLKRLVENSNHKKYEHVVISLTRDGVIGESLKSNGFEVYSLNLNMFSFWC